MKKLFIIICMGGLLTLCGCQLLSVEPPYEYNPPSAVPYGVDALAVDMFRHVVAQEKGNVVFSPASAEAVLLMLRDGAAGQTRRELDALPYGKQDVTSAMQVESANAIFADDSLTIKPGATSVQRVPFADNPAKAVDIVNAWCSEKTHGKISAILSPLLLSKDTRLIATNAVYLKEKWLRPFMPSSTRPQEFHLSNGSTVRVPMMHQEANLLYAKGKDWQAVALFYRRDGRKGEPGCFIGILPKGDARAFAATLTPQKFNAIRTALAQSGYEHTEVFLPRFEVNPPAFSLATALQTLGVRAAFSKQAADLRNLAQTPDGTPLYLSDIVQRCYVKADEQGTKAAAVTGMAVAIQSAPIIKEPRIIRFDKPFLWVIADLSTAAPPYFMGLVETP